MIEAVYGSERVKQSARGEIVISFSKVQFDEESGDE